VPRFDAIGITVEDMGRSLAFYRHLGLDIPDDGEAEPHVEAALPGGLRLMFDTVELMRSLGPWETPGPGRGVGLAFLCDDPEQVDDTYASLLEAGHTGRTAPFDAFWGQRYATVLDPDGNPVDLFAPLA
jgi:uncharacterized glyoxalase superfamily protein PhnB